MLKNHVFGSFNLNKSEKHRLSFEDIFLGTLDTYTKKMNPPSAVLGGGVHGKVSWLIAYIGIVHASDIMYLYNFLNYECIIARIYSKKTVVNFISL